ncbi:trichohyalin isoform X1 [Antennarius striatus]|uniref:trichohyalin isoform X1 n=1 Tax=Antennarius striatus TaxID=241820 RepID=UPI0035B17F1C
MGTKKPSNTIYDKTKTSDRNLHPGERISRDPSPRPAMTAQSERDRDGNREEDWRRERETEKMKDKTRYRDMDPRERYYERDRAPVPTPRQRRQEDDNRKNGRPLSHVESEREEAVRGMRKGDTFPRMRRGGAGHSKSRTTTEKDGEEGERRQKDRPKGLETDGWQRERCKEREADEIRSRTNERERNPGRRPLEETSRQKERYLESDVVQNRRRELVDSWDRRERDADRKRGNPRDDMGRRERRVSSPHRIRERDNYTERKEREKPQRKDGWRNTRSEGDSEEREMRRERDRDRRREELQYQHSQSEGENTIKTNREKDRDRRGYREEDRQRYRDREREGDRSRRRGVEKDRERYREFDRRGQRQSEEEDKYKVSLKDMKDDRKEDGRFREYKQRRWKETMERESDPKWDDSTDRSSRSLNERAPRVPQAQSSGEWSTTESEKDVEEQINSKRVVERSKNEKIRYEKQDREGVEMTGSIEEQRRMWLEPQRGKNSKGEFADTERYVRKRSKESQVEWGSDGQTLYEQPYDRYLDHSSYRGQCEGRREYKGNLEWQTEGVSVDGEEMDEEMDETGKEIDKRRKGHLSHSDGEIEGNWQRDAEGENVTDSTEESDREEEGGSDYWVRSESEGGSETGEKQDRYRILSGEDGFVTVSSGGDEGDERDEDEEEEFEDCQEFWDVVYDGSSPALLRENEREKGREDEWTTGNEELVDKDKQGKEKQPKYIFCVIGHTLPKAASGETSLSQVDQVQEVESDNPVLKSHPYSQDNTQKPQDDQHVKLIRNEYPIINNQEKENKSKFEIPGEEKTPVGEIPEVDIRHRVLPELENKTVEGMRQEKEHPYAEIGPINRDSLTERLLTEWREKNKETGRERERPSPLINSFDNEQIQPILDVINSGAMSPEEMEAIRIRLSGAWSMSEEPKRHSQAPHLKWAKDVLQEILGHSEDQSLDESGAGVLGGKGVNQPEIEIRYEKQHTGTEDTGEMPVLKLGHDGLHSEPELEEEPLEVEGLRGMGHSQADMHADQFTAMHDDTPTYTHADTLIDTEGKDHTMDKETECSGQLHLDKCDKDEEISEMAGNETELLDIQKEARREKEVEMYLSVSNTLYKPSSCPILNYETEFGLHVPSNDGEDQELKEREGQSKRERQGEEADDAIVTEDLGKMREGEVTETDGRQVLTEEQVKGKVLTSCSFRDLGPEARFRRRGIRKTTERRNGEHVEVKEEEEEEEEGGVGRDRRTRIFSVTDDEDDKCKSWGEVELRNVLDTIEKRKRNSRFFNAAQLYQQYSEAAQNFEILRQARSDAISLSEDATRSPAPSPPPARRPLPPLPTVQHPHSFSHTGSITSVRSLPLPEPPKREGRPPSPRLSISLSSTLWRDLPGVRNSTELEELSEDQRRLQEVRFELVTSEASYCRSLDIVVEHFVKSKQLGALLTTQDRNWLFSRLADVRAISHSFLSKLEERVETDIISFTVCDIIARHCQRFKMVYVPYLTNQSYQDATYQRLMNENQGFRRIVEKLERSPVCQRLPLRSFLVLPFQRITRIKLLVQNIVKRTSPGTTEATQAIKALKLLEKLIQESNDSITQMKSIESLVSLSAKVDFECRTLPLISQSRRLVREGPVTELMDFSLKETERNIYLHLFNDYLLLSLQKEGGRFTVIDHSPVSELRVENCRVKLHSLQKNLFRLHMSRRALLLRTDTQSDKLRWISALSLPHPEVDFSAAQDFTQMQCIRAFVAQQPDELSLEKADIILVHQQSSDNWVEGTRVSDRHRGWVTNSHLETITNSRVRQRNLSDALKLTTATAAV